MIHDINRYLEIDNKKLIWDKKINKNKFLENYKRKCSLVGGNFYAHCLELGYLKSKNKNLELKKHLINIGMIFGTAYQMVHEVADIIPPKFKRFPEDFKYYQQQYNSLRKHKITLPIYFALFEWRNFDKKLFIKLIKKEKYELVTQMLLKKKIIKKSKTYIRKSLKPIKEEFKFLPKGRWSLCLRFGTNSVNSNIFWRDLKKLYAGVA